MSQTDRPQTDRRETDAQSAERWARKIAEAERRQTGRAEQTDETEAQRRMAEDGLRRAIADRRR